MSSILWKRLDTPGHESARVHFQDARWNLTGTAVFAHEQEPCRLDYAVRCDSRWQTAHARITGWIGNIPIEVEVSVYSNRRWFLNGTECPEAQGCIDLDLHFSPSTNLLPIRRLNLRTGDQAEVRAAWLRFPSFNLQPLEQSYCRQSENTYRYRSAGGKFERQLTVNETGFVTLYPDFWEIEQ